MEEIWKDIPGYEGLYQVSNLGNVKSLYNNRLLKLCWRNTKKEYKAVYLSKKTKKTFFVHRLVAIAFIPNPDNKPCVDHINGDRLDNRVDNLKWVTNKENNNPIR